MNEENNLGKSITQVSNPVKTPSMTTSMNPLVPSTNDTTKVNQVSSLMSSPLNTTTPQPSPLASQMDSTMNVAKNAIRQRTKMPEPKPAQRQGVQQSEPKPMQQGDAIMQLLTNANKMQEQANTPIQTASQSQAKQAKADQPKVESIGGNYAQSIGMTNYKFRKNQDEVPSYQYNDTTILMPEGVDINDDIAVNNAVSNVNSMVDIMDDLYA
jgi:hypothetical protein